LKDLQSHAPQAHLNVGINTTGYLPAAWKYRSGNRHDIYDPATTSA